MAGSKGECLIDIPQRRLNRLARQGVHQVQIHPPERLDRMRSRGPGGLAVVDPANPLQGPRIKTLHTQRQAIDARLKKPFEPGCFERSWIGFERDLGIRNQSDPSPDTGNQALDSRGRQQARSSATKENGMDRSPPDHWQC